MKKFYLFKVFMAGVCLVSVNAVSFAADKTENYAYIYPTIIKSGKNILNPDLKNWRGQSIPGILLERGKGSPFSAETPNLMLKSTVTKPRYWGVTNKVPGNRTFLVGAWVKNDNAKILLWFFGNYGRPVRRLNDRIYFYSGASQLLKNYLSPESERLLGGDPEAWHLCYRLVQSPKEVKTFYLNMMVGTYFATGNITVAEPFIIDVTEVGNSGITVDVKGKRAIKEITVINLYDRDAIWRKKFDRPVTVFKQDIPGTNFKHGLDAKIEFNGYLLKVEYTDGEIVIFTAPEEGSFKHLT